MYAPSLLYEHARDGRYEEASMAKALLSLSGAMLVTIVAARLAFIATTETGSEPANEPWAQSKMEFVAWNGQRWVGWIRDGAFELRPQEEGRWRRHSNPSIAFINWDGEFWQAKVDDDEFLLAHRGYWSGPIERAPAIRYRDWTGKNQLRTVVQLRR